MRPRLCTVIIAALAIGCTTHDPAPPGTERQGVAELRVDAASLLAVAVTRVTVEGGGASVDLPLNPFTSTFDGRLFLPSGTQSVVARAFSGDALVGQSNPVAVDIPAGGVARVVLRILDLTGQAPPIYGPIFDTLVAPTTGQAGVPVTFVASAIAPIGDPVTYAWSTDCTDAAFSDPASGTTGWTKQAPGTCTINVTATSNGFGVSQTFVILVFQAEPGGGAVDVSATFITAPVLHLFLPEVGCSVLRGGNSTCTIPIASSSVTAYTVAVLDWGPSSPGTLEVSDSCGGAFGTTSGGTDAIDGFWLPPTTAGLCFVTARAVDSDGVVSTLSAAILVRPGIAASAEPPLVFASLPGCALGDASTPTDCGSFAAGSGVFASVGVSLIGQSHPGSLTVSDDCFGPLPPGNFFSYFASWTVPSVPGTTCTTTVRAATLEGSVREVAGRYQVF